MVEERERGMKRWRILKDESDGQMKGPQEIKGKRGCLSKHSRESIGQGEGE